VGRSPLKIDQDEHVWAGSLLKIDQYECVGRSPLKIDQDEHVWAGRP